MPSTAADLARRLEELGRLADLAEDRRRHHGSCEASCATCERLDAALERARAELFWAELAYARASGGRAAGTA
jgi:hypothetical protein